MIEEKDASRGLLEKLRLRNGIFGPGKKVGIFLGVLFIGIVIFLGLWGWAYAHSDRSSDEYHEPIIGFPVLWVGLNHVVSSSTLSKDLNAIRSFYENQDFSSVGLRVDFSTDDGKKRLKLREKELLNIYIDQEVKRRIVYENGDRVTQAEVDMSVERKLREYGSENTIEGELERLYGWDVEDFKHAVVEPALYDEKARSQYERRENDERDKRAREKIEQAKAQLEKGDSFEKVVSEYSEGVTASFDGRVGWLSLGELVEPEVAKAVISMGEGEVSDVIESNLGYHIVKIHATKSDSTGMLYDMSQIFTKKTTYADWIAEYRRNLNVRVFVQGYTWDKTSGMVVFSEEEMKNFEREVLSSDLEEVSPEVTPKESLEEK